jgi:hypothetical protein
MLAKDTHATRSVTKKTEVYVMRIRLQSLAIKFCLKSAADEPTDHEIKLFGIALNADRYFGLP